jgi:hypothetical protein
MDQDFRPLDSFIASKMSCVVALVLTLGISNGDFEVVR